MTTNALGDSIRYWEPRRVWYNAALVALTTAWVVATWPHFQPAMTVGNGLRLLVLAALANLCYCAGYLVDLPLQDSALADTWRRWRWALWVLGTVFALVFATYWIGDEIYPYVGSA